MSERACTVWTPAFRRPLSWLVQGTTLALSRTLGGTQARLILLPSIDVRSMQGGMTIIKLQQLLHDGFFGHEYHPDMVLSVNTGLPIVTNARMHKSEFSSMNDSLLSIPWDTDCVSARRARRRGPIGAPSFRRLSAGEMRSPSLIHVPDHLPSRRSSYRIPRPLVP